MQIRLSSTRVSHLINNLNLTKNRSKSQANCSNADFNILWIGLRCEEGDAFPNLTCKISSMEVSNNAIHDTFRVCMLFGKEFLVSQSFIYLTKKFRVNWSFFKLCYGSVIELFNNNLCLNCKLTNISDPLHSLAHCFTN